MRLCVGSKVAEAGLQRKVDWGGNARSGLSLVQSLSGLGARAQEHNLNESIDDHQ